MEATVSFCISIYAGQARRTDLGGFRPRESGDADSGRNFGSADVLHSTFNDLLIRHWAGLVPRFDDTLEVRPLDLGLGDLRIDDIAYHGHRVAIAITGDTLAVFVDGQQVGQGSAGAGLVLEGVL